MGVEIMKIDGIELLNKMKNKEILEGTKIFCDRFINNDIYIVYEKGNLYLYERNGTRYDKDKWTGVIRAEDLLKYTFEIIEEDKKIEKLDIEMFTSIQENFKMNDLMLSDKINEIIEKLNEMDKGE